MSTVVQAQASEGILGFFDTRDKRTQRRHRTLVAIAIYVWYDEPNDQCIAPQLRSTPDPGSLYPNSRRCTPLGGAARLRFSNFGSNFHAPLRVSKWPLARY